MHLSHPLCVCVCERSCVRAKLWRGHVTPCNVAMCTNVCATTFVTTIVCLPVVLYW